MRAVEYYRQLGGLDRYFVTADRGEMALLDYRSWEFLAYVRTGRAFNVWPYGTSPPPGASPVCRFYGPPDKGLDSHFFSASPAECDAVKQRFGGTWIYETADAFVARVPDASGTCAAGTTPVYRLFNNRAAANHRSTTTRAVRDEMVAKGSISEGEGAAGVAMCAP